MNVSMKPNDQIAYLYKRIERMEREHHRENSRLIDWCHALTLIIFTLMVVLFFLICNIYFRLGVIPDFGM